MIIVFYFIIFCILFVVTFVAAKVINRVVKVDEPDLGLIDVFVLATLMLLLFL